MFDAGDVVDMARRMPSARMRFSFLMGFSQGLVCFVWPMQWKLFVSSSISRMTLGFHVFEAMDVCEGANLEEATAFSGVRSAKLADDDLPSHVALSASLVSVDEMMVFGRFIGDVPKFF